MDTTVRWWTTTSARGAVRHKEEGRRMWTETGHVSGFVLHARSRLAAVGGIIKREKNKKKQIVLFLYH